MDKPKDEVSGARQVQKHAENEKRSLDTTDAVWTVQLQIDGKSEKNRITS
jgi:hypothetical protein